MKKILSSTLEILSALLVAVFSPILLVFWFIKDIVLQLD